MNNAKVALGGHLQDYVADALGDVILVAAVVVIDVATTDHRRMLARVSMDATRSADLPGWQIMGLLSGTYEEVIADASRRREE